jgi:hypothetical protein
MQNSLLIAGGALGCLLLGVIGLMLMQRGTMLAQQSRSPVHAPECSLGLPWLNTDQPLTIAGLPVNEGRLDCWTSCCIRGMHIIPDLISPEKKSPNELMVTGVHAGDTHNHAIRGSDLASGEVSTLKLSGLEIADAAAGFEKLIPMDGEVINMPSQAIKASIEGQLVINVQLPAGYKLNPMAPVSYAVYVRGGGIQIPHSGRTLSAHAIEFPLTLSFQTSPGTHRAALDVEATFYWCREDNTGVCMIQSTRWHVPVETSETAENRLLLISGTA